MSALIGLAVSARRSSLLGLGVSRACRPGRPLALSRAGENEPKSVTGLVENHHHRLAQPSRRAGARAGEPEGRPTAANQCDPRSCQLAPINDRRIILSASRSIVACRAFRLQWIYLVQCDKFNCKCVLVCVCRCLCRFHRCVLILRALCRRRRQMIARGSG